MNAVTVYGLTILGNMAILCALTSIWLEGTAREVSLKALSIQRFTPLRHPIYAERVDMTFSLKADVRHLFHWNVKQMYVYVVAEYVTDSHDINQVVVWDKIVRTDCKEIKASHRHLDAWCPDDPRLLKGHELYNKYHLLHPHKQLRANAVKLSLHYDIMPLVGAVFPTEMPSSWFNQKIRRTDDFDYNLTLPDEYAYEAMYVDE